VRVEVVTIASEVAGKIISVPIIDNQKVTKGQLLYEIDPTTYQLRFAETDAMVQSKQASWHIAKEDADRRARLGRGNVISTEELQRYASTAAQAKAQLDQAVAQRNSAQVDLARTKVYSPVNGYVINLHLRVGDYASPGTPALSIVDSDSFWIAGYFEETKLPFINVGDIAEIHVMGPYPVFSGKVESLARGIEDTNSGMTRPGLPSVDPIFTWVRLAQRIPVRIQIDLSQIPNGIELAAGQTCTIQIHHNSRNPASTHTATVKH
jgi:RND family efflux transporter MFP subunit